MIKKQRKEAAFGKIVLWKQLLRARKFHGLQFERQFLAGNFVVDFICRSKKLIIEVDGYSFDFTYRDNDLKDRFLSNLGYTIFRFKEKDVMYNLDEVIKALESYIEESVGV